MFIQKAFDTLQIVVVRQVNTIRDVHRRGRTHKVQGAAVVAAGKGNDAGSPGKGRRGGKREQVGFGAGVGETHLLDATESINDQGRQSGFE
ncbi:hypothetical protein D3C86_1565580 [compost metagenome]